MAEERLSRLPRRQRARRCAEPAPCARPLDTRGRCGTPAYGLRDARRGEWASEVSRCRRRDEGGRGEEGAAVDYEEEALTLSLAGSWRSRRGRRRRARAAIPLCLPRTCSARCLAAQAAPSAAQAPSRCRVASPPHPRAARTARRSDVGMHPLPSPAGVRARARHSCAAEACPAAVMQPASAHSVERSGGRQTRASERIAHCGARRGAAARGSSSTAAAQVQQHRGEGGREGDSTRLRAARAAQRGRPSGRGEGKPPCQPAGLHLLDLTCTAALQQTEALLCRQNSCLTLSIYELRAWHVRQHSSERLRCSACRVRPENRPLALERLFTHAVHGPHSTLPWCVPIAAARVAACTAALKESASQSERPRASIPGLLMLLLAASF